MPIRSSTGLAGAWTRVMGDPSTINVRVPGAGRPAAPLDPAWQTSDDRTLVEACLNGRPEAFDLIVERHQRQVYQLCRRFVRSHEDASDLAQDVFVRAYRGLRGFKSHAALGTWLYRIAVNVSLNHVSAKAPGTEAIDANAHEDLRAERPDTALLRAERSAEVRAAIARLPPRQRATLILRVYHDLPHTEIAEILGSSVGSAKANFFHALANLRKLLR